MSPARTTHRRSKVLVAVSAALVLAVLAAFVAEIGRAYPGFFFTADYRVFPMTAAAEDAGLQYGDRLLAVDGRSPITLMERVRASGAPVRYDVARGDERLTLTLAPALFTWAVFAGTFAGFFIVSALLLAVGAVVHAQNPAAPPNRVFLLYMCLWAVSNVAAPESVLGFGKTSGIIVGFVSTLLSVHGWIFFLTYPVNAAREAWLREHGVARALYAGAAVAGLVAAAVFGGVQVAAPELFVTTPLYRVATGALFALALLSFPVKIAALAGTRRRAASPLVNQQTSVLLLGIGLGLGFWLLLMLAPLTLVYRPPVDLQIGSALVLLYPLAIAYATVRYRLFDVTVVIRRSVVYTALAALIAGAYALAIAAANVLLAQADLARSPWFSAAFVFVVALVFYPVRERLQRAVDRTFFRERYDYAAAIQALARSMASLLDLEEITRRLTSTIERVMHARNPRLAVGTPAAALVSAFGVAPGALSRYQLAADPSYAAIASAALEAYRALGAEVVVPLRFQDELRGLLVLGPKRSEAPYTAEDLALLETLADQTAVAVANAAAHHQVVEYARQLERSLLIRTNLAKFVPQRVRDLIEESPEAPSLDKRETEVSVLFADITGYTRLSERMAGETLDALVERYFGAFLDEIVKHGGDVSETAGDGLMVIFHEGDHPRAAVETARAIHRRAAELNAALAPAVEPLAMHIGVNTGPALLGATKIEGITGTRWVYTASGHTTNIASRLAAEAGGGDVILSDSTRVRLGDGFSVEPLGARPLKNVEAPVALFRLR